MLKEFKIAGRLLLLLSILTGIVYPLLVTGVAQGLFPFQANGSLIQNKGSALLGISFTQEQYFWGRSMRAPIGASNPLLVNALKQEIDHLHKTESDKRIPIDLVTASGSQLDPDISPEAAFYQISRIAKARSIPEKQLEALVQRSIKQCSMHIFGEPRVNVLLLNLELDKLATQ